MENKRCGFVALIGAPNAGKSTLLNALVGSKLAIVTPKVQTTRDVIRGIVMVENCQMIYLDTPGIFTAQHRFEKAMVESAWNGARDADAAVLLMDAERASRKGLDEQEKALLRALRQMKKPRALWLNKTDKLNKPELMQLIAQLGAETDGVEVFMGSALKGHLVPDLQQWLVKQMPAGEWMFPQDQISDMPMRFIAAEITREKLFLRLRQELPYGLAVMPEQWEERPDGSVKISQVIMVEREAHKKILLGKQGTQLKEISQSSRLSLEKMLERKVHLFLFIKVVPDWKDRPHNPHA